MNCNNFNRKNFDNIEASPELLVPAGDFECLRAGVQNGANAIYFGSSSFSARASAKNFSIPELQEAIKYCKLRNVKTNLTINTLLTNDEFSSAFELAEKAYSSGIDAIIVQDLGFAKYLIKNLPNLDIHASTQMSVHNLEGVLELAKLGFKRVVLSRELSINEIEYIRNNCNVELEMFIHGALCISYSGQCLFSSMVGGRSGNRGKCAQPCRLPYELIEESSSIQKNIGKGYLLSPRDLCSLDYIPTLVKSGVNSFKVEGRMKTPEYVATVTRIYRKYIDLAMSNAQYVVSEKDKKDLLQVFNRGNFSSGHLGSSPNRNLIFESKPNNIGLYLGNISNYNANKGIITLQLNEPLSIGDTISIDGENGRYTVSELMIKGENFKNATTKTIVKIGRMKGNIKAGSKVYKLSSKLLCDEALASYNNDSNAKIPIDLHITIKRNTPICVKLSANIAPFYNNIEVTYTSDVIPEVAINSPVTADRIIAQFSKLGNTPYLASNVTVDLDDNLFIPSISILNTVRRNAIDLLINTVIKKALSNRELTADIPSLDIGTINNANNQRKISLLLEDINLDYDYNALTGADNIYIPLKFFSNKKYHDLIMNLSQKFSVFVYMPTIIKANYKNLLLNNLDNIVKTFNIKGFVVSNIAGVIFLQKYMFNPNYTIVSNYTMNVLNDYTINELKDIGINIVTPSVEANEHILDNIIKYSSLPIELIVYGRTILMNSSYCLLGKTNKCYPECDMKCKLNSKYYLKDRLGFKFRVIPDNLQTVTSIYNSKITSIESSNFSVYSFRINVLDESIEDINKIISVAKSGKRLEGPEYTNGNLNKNV